MQMGEAEDHLTIVRKTGDKSLLPTHAQGTPGVHPSFSAQDAKKNITPFLSD